MQATSIDRRIPLPRHWPRRVRSAVIHAVSMANVAFIASRCRVEHQFDARAWLQSEKESLRREVSLINEEIRIKDARMECVPAQRRPHYPPIERLAILELRAARGWSLAQTARRFLVTPLTIASWTQRLDDEGPAVLVQVREPVNRFPDFVSYLVQRLKVLCPKMGTRRIARVLARAGLHLGATTVRRMLQSAPKPTPASSRPSKPRAVTAKRPNHVWHLDLTTVPTIGGFWISWLPLSLPQRWPFCCWVAVVVDNFSRRAMGPRTSRRNRLLRRSRDGSGGYVVLSVAGRATSSPTAARSSPPMSSEPGVGVTASNSG